MNELIQREISHILHTRYQKESVLITITSVDVSPDLRNARVYYSVLGDEEQVEEAGRWLRSKTGEVGHELGRRVVLKFTPQLQFLLDMSPQRGAHILRLLDELEEQEGK